MQRALNQTTFDRRRRLKQWLWMLLPAALVAGYVYPPLGAVVLACMAGAIGMSFAQGRAWCDVCPRGAFFDVVMRRVSPQRPMPRLLRSTAFRAGAMVLIMGLMGLQLGLVWGDLHAMGAVFFRLLLVTSLLGVILALFINARTWCNICPMGTMAGWIGRRKRPLQVKDSCVSCGACDKACPMGLSPSSYKEAGQMEHSDCLKCNACVAKCPKAALGWDQAA